MTKCEVENVIKRYRFIDYAIKQELDQANFYIGNRKKVVEISEEVKTVCQIVSMVYSNESNLMIHSMIKNIITGEKDTFTMREIYCTKSSYYPLKKAFANKIYNCCISMGLVTLEEILSEPLVKY